MINRIKSVDTIGNFTLVATFFNGVVKQYDVNNLFSVHPQLEELKDKKLFDSVHVDTGGYGVSWNDDLDLDAETIWEFGDIIRVEEIDIALDVAAQLIEARNKSGITQKQLSEKTGIHQSDISRIERGIANPSLNTLKRLATGMGMRLQLKFTPIER